MQPKTDFARKAGVFHSFVERNGFLHAVKICGTIGAFRKMLSDLAASGRIEPLIKIVANVKGDLLTV